MLFESGDNALTPWSFQIKNIHGSFPTSSFYNIQLVSGKINKSLQLCFSIACFCDFVIKSIQTYQNSTLSCD